jgi:hypothetical protein
MTVRQMARAASFLIGTGWLPDARGLADRLRVSTSALLFGLRLWAGVCLALYLSFWLQLEAPQSAALTVAILAFPTNAQGLEKAGYRLAATIAGVAASFAVDGMSAQTDRGSALARISRAGPTGPHAVIECPAQEDSLLRLHS